MINEKYFETFPQLETERLILRKQVLADAKDLQAIRSDERVMNFMDSERHTTLQHSEEFISENMKVYKDKKGIFWTLTDRSTNEFIGDFIFRKIDSKNSRAEIGYTLKPEFWGKGLMMEAMIEILRFGFTRLQLHSFEANINPENTSSKGLLLKMGFIKEAYFKENFYYDGKFLDSEIYSLLQKNFKYN